MMDEVRAACNPRRYIDKAWHETVWIVQLREFVVHRGWQWLLEMVLIFCAHPTCVVT